MDNQDDLANEHVLMDPESGVLVRFQTKSDLLLASFMLGNRNLPNCPFVPLHIVNSLLQHVRDPNYDRAQVIRNNGKDIIAQILSHHSISPPSQENRNSVYSIAILILLRNEEFVSEGISLTDGVHILRSVADARRQATQECSFWKYNTLFSVAVLERTAEFLVEEDFREIRTEYWRPERVGRVRSGVSSTLRNMSLVHRSWTDPAQRAMRSSIIVFSAASIYALLRNPFSCKQLRAFVYNPGPYEFDPITQITQLLSALVESAPNLEQLFLGTVFCWQRGFDLPGTVMTDSGYKPGPSTPGFVNIIPKLSAFRKLRVFYIEGQDLFLINQLWCALSEMHCLEDLALLGWLTPNVDLDALSGLSTLPPPAFLESVHVSFQYHHGRGQPNIHDALVSEKGSSS